MRPTAQLLEDIFQEIGLSDKEIRLRKEFLDFTETDVTMLVHAHALLAMHKSEFADAFYAHLLKFPALQPFLSDSATLARLKLAQAAYFDSMTAGDYDMDYVRHRLLVGVVHQQIGLDPKWYIGAYRKYLSLVLPLLWRLLSADMNCFFATCDALLKVACFDMGLAFDTYGNASRQSIAQHKNYTEHIVSCLPSGVIVADSKLRVCLMNPVMRQMLKMPAAAPAPEGMPLAVLLHSQQMLEIAAEVLENGVARRELGMSAAGRQAGRFDLQFSFARSALGGEPLVVVICEDLAPLLQTKMALQESEERFRLSFSDAAVGMAHLATDCRMLRTNRKLQEMLGYSAAELMQLTLQAITHPDDHEPDRLLLQQLLHGEIREYTREKRYVHKNGSYIWVSVAVSFMRDSRGRTRFIAVIEDVSQRKQVEHEILHLANHDALTGLPNRALMQARLYDVILQAQDRDGQIAVLFLDLDRFKNINDSLGHHVGDQVIIEAGKRIAGVMRNSDTVARQGGDEFLILLGEVTSFTDVETVARRILDAIARPMILQDHEVYISASIGISMYPKDGRDGVTLMKNADTAMYQAKRSGRGRYEFFGDELNGLALARFKLEGALRHALERHEFVLYYQPQIDIVSNDIVGLEALIRWQSGTSLVAPDEFIPLAEESGLIIPMGEWVLATACRQIKCWHDAGRSDLKMSVNLSGCQFRQQDIVEMVQRILSETGCPASALVLEITESVVMDNPQATAEILRRLSTMGVGLAIDDFGTGYSSLTYLKRFPIDTLKIDRSFIRDLVTDNDDAAIVKSVIALAHAMNRNIVAEGVETGEQLEFLRLHGCNQAQGYYSGKPLPANLTTPILLAQRMTIIGDSSVTMGD